MWLRIVIVASIGSLGLIGFAYVFWLRNVSEAMIVIVIGFLINFVTPIFAVVVGVHDLERRLRRIEATRGLGRIVDFWTVPAPRKPWIVLSGGRLFAPNDPEVRVSFSTVYAFSQIEQTLHRIYGHEINISFNTLADIGSLSLSACNVVLLGGIEKIPAVKGILEIVPKGAIQTLKSDGTREITISDTYSDAKMNLVSQYDGSYVSRDHAIVMKIVDKRNEFSLFTFSGGWGAGTVSGVLAMTSMHLFNEYGFSADKEINQTVVSVRGSSSGPVYRGHGEISCRNWSAQRLEGETLSALLGPLRSIATGVNQQSTT